MKLWEWLSVVSSSMLRNNDDWPFGNSRLMTPVRKRLDHLEAQRRKHALAGSALLVGGGGMGREPGETESAFMARASEGVTLPFTKQQKVGN